jgi:hypothetical protein
MINEIKLLRKIEEICHKPQRFTSHGTFEEVANLLEKEGKKYIEGEFYYHSVFTPFLKWLVNKNGSEIAINLKVVKKLFSSNDEALENLPILYKEYLENLESFKIV